LTSIQTDRIKARWKSFLRTIGTTITTLTTQDYNLPNYPKAGTDGYVLEHIFVFEMFHQCCMLKWGVVHHINGIRTDNRPENLAGMTRGAHTTLHHPTQLEYRDNLQTHLDKHICRPT
jgi:HNH endonuclease